MKFCELYKPKNVLPPKYSVRAVRFIQDKQKDIFSIARLSYAGHEELACRGMEAMKNQLDTLTREGYPHDS